MPMVRPLARCWCVASPVSSAGLIARRRPRRVAAVLDEIALRLRRIEALARCQQRGPFAIEVDQLLGDRLALRRIGVQQVRRAAPAQHRRQLPAEIEAVLHRDVHALAGFRAVRVAGIAGDEHARQALPHSSFGHVIELVAQALADLVDRPPGDLLHVERMGIENAPRRRDQIVGRDVAIGDALVGAELVELDIQAKQIAALARNDDDAAVAGGLDQRLEADVGEIGDGEHVHHAPGVIGGVAVRARARSTCARCCARRRSPPRSAP